MNIPIETSGRHVHLKKENFQTLFGNDAKLTVRNSLTQPGTFAAQETVTLETEKGKIEKVRVLGPLRKYTQVEISITDAYSLGIKPPIRDTHELELEGTPGITIIGPKGKVVLEEGVIIPWRHIHMSPNQAIQTGVKDGELVNIDIDNHPRSVIFENVLIRVKSNYKLAMHIDTDEANAAGIQSTGEGKLLKQS